jgi:hypothetical protein
VTTTESSSVTNDRVELEVNTMVTREGLSQTEAHTIGDLAPSAIIVLLKALEVQTQDRREWSFETSTTSDNIVGVVAEITLIVGDMLRSDEVCQCLLNT